MKPLTAALLVLLGVRVQGGCLPEGPAEVRASAFVCPAGQVCVQSIRVLVSWKDVARSEKGYLVERSVFDGASWWPWERVATLPRNATEAIDGVPVGVEIAYRVTAVGQCGSTSVVVMYP